MFAPRRSPAASSEGQNPKFKDVLLCEGSSSPLAVPGALIGKIWDQISEGLQAVPRGGAEVGGLFLGRRSQTSIVLAEAVVPIPVEYKFGPAFRLSPSDLQGLEKLLSFLQKDGSKTIVGLYRSRTRNDSLSEESESAVLSVLEKAHTSFISDFHYFVAFTPLSKLTMTASASFRAEEGWDAWQHVTLVMNPKSSAQPIEFVAPPKASQASSSSATTAPALRPESHANTVADPLPPSQPGSIAPEAGLWQPPAEPHSRTYLDWAPPEPPTGAPQDVNGGARAWWYAAGGVLLALVVFSVYPRTSPATLPVTVREIHSDLTSASAPAAAGVGFSATWEGSVWKLAWDRAAVDALRPAGAVLTIRDGADEQRVDLAASDLTRGTIFYKPQAGDLLFSLNILLPDGQVVEEHVRVLQGPRNMEVRAEPSATIVVPSQVRSVRPFTPAPNSPNDTGGSRAVAEVPAPPVLTPASNQALSSVLPIAPSAPVQLPVSKTPASPETDSAPAGVDLVQRLAGSWAATFSDSPFATETASITLAVSTRDVDGWFLGKYKVPKNGRPFKEVVNFQFRGNLDKDKLPDGAWAFPFKSVDGWQGNIKLRAQGTALDVTWKASLEDGKTYTFEHVMGRPASK